MMSAAAKDKAYALIEKAQPYLQLCPSCDAGLPMSCTCPPGDSRTVLQELVTALEELIDS
jgi:hypothetical protein